MSDELPETIDLRAALDKHTIARSFSRSISTLLQSKRKTIDFSPYYQRNYVWDVDKATFFIESVLLGIEIPPIIVFISSDDKKKYEVIDGRQRFETLKRFYENDFKLTKQGLRKLSGLSGYEYDRLVPEIQDTFRETTIRIIEFSTIGDLPNRSNMEDSIKKEIFWRYNSGITPLKTLEVQKASYLHDDFTQLLDEQISSNPRWLSVFKKVFFAKPSSTPTEDIECQARIRELLVLEYFPINIYATTSTRRDTFEWLYELNIKESEDQHQMLESFVKKILLLEKLFDRLNETQWLLYQSVFWGLSVLENNDINIDTYFNDESVSFLAKKIEDKIELFTGDDRGFSKNTKERFKYMSEIMQKILKQNGFQEVDFSLYLSKRLGGRTKQDQSDITSAIAELNNSRLNRPDAVTKTIEDLIEDVQNNSFLIRPAYQRKEVINIKKASGIIESMLLGIPLPTFFIYRRKNNTCEVVDGQQRLLSILAFLGQHYKDEKNKKIQSNKHKFKLYKELNILKELSNDDYDKLDDTWQDKLLDFELSLVYIEEKLNANFDEIDLFIRLNNKPFPVKDHTFEMWNSYSDRLIVENIKRIVRTHKDWFYYRKDNRRMNNEELITIFSYLSSMSKSNIDDMFGAVEIYYTTSSPFTFRLAKKSVTDWLKNVDDECEGKHREEIQESIDMTEKFIQKLHLIATHIGTTHPDLGDINESFQYFLSTKGPIRQQKPFYILWFLLFNISHKSIEKNIDEIANKTRTIIQGDLELDTTSPASLSKSFKIFVHKFWEKFEPTYSSHQ